MKTVSLNYYRKDSEDMKKSDWGIEITKVNNGFLLKSNDDNKIVVQADEDDESSAAEKLLWQVIEFFNLNGGRYDRERVSVIVRTGDKYTPKNGEKIVRGHYLKVVRDK